MRVRAASAVSASKIVQHWWWRVCATPHRSIVADTQLRISARLVAWMNGCGRVVLVTSNTPSWANSAAYASASRSSMACE